MHPSESYGATALVSAWPAPRMAPFLREASHDAERSLELYRWNHQMAADCLTVVSHVEVLLRHRTDTLLSSYFDEPVRGIPWFMQPGALNARQQEDLQKVQKRLVANGKLSRDQIIAGTDIGFWNGFFSSSRQELWNKALHGGFDKRMVKTRADVSSALEKARTFRNRLAHHDSLLRVSVHEEVHNLLWLARAMDARLAAWISDGSAWKDTYSARPTVQTDTVIVAARHAWPLYQASVDVEELGAGFYVCRPGRAFRDVQRLGFYADQAIQADVPGITSIHDNVPWTLAHADAVLGDDAADRGMKKVARFIRWSFAGGRRFNLVPDREVSTDDAAEPSGRYKVFVLTRPGNDPRHLTLDRPLAHSTTGRGSAFTQRQRYVPSHRLAVAASTRDLDDD